MKAKTLRVWANPYARIDHEGRPTGAVQRLIFGPDFELMASDTHQFVGAQMIVDVVRTAQRGNGQNRYTHVVESDAHFEFSDEPVLIWNSGRNPHTVSGFRHYSDAISHGALLPADEETARFFGVKYVPREQALEAAKRAALEHLKAHDVDDEDVLALDVPKLGARAEKVRAETERKRRIAKGPSPEAEPEVAKEPKPTTGAPALTTDATPLRSGLVSLAAPLPTPDAAPASPALEGDT